MTYEDNYYIKDLRELKFEKPLSDKAAPVYPTYKLGDQVANGIRWWGNVSKDKRSRTTAVFICPRCENTWRCRLSNIISGSTKSCGCKQTA